MSAAIFPFRTKPASVVERDRKAALHVLLPMLQRCARNAVPQADTTSVWASPRGGFFVRRWDFGADGLNIRVDRGREPLLTIYLVPGKAPSVATWRQGWEAEFLKCLPPENESA